MEIKLIRNKTQYRAALKAVEPFFDKEPKAGTPEADQFEVMLLLIEDYEKKHYPIAAPDPIEAIKFRLDQMELGLKALMPMIGGMNRVYEVMNKTRPLTLNMMRNINRELGVPLDILVAEYAVKEKAPIEEKAPAKAKSIAKGKPHEKAKSMRPSGAIVRVKPMLLPTKSKSTAKRKTLTA